MKVKMEGGSGERRIGDISLLGYFSRRSLGTFLSVVGDLTSPPFPHDETEKWGEVAWGGKVRLPVDEAVDHSINCSLVVGRSQFVNYWSLVCLSVQLTLRFNG